MSFSILSKRDEFGYPLKFDIASAADLNTIETSYDNPLGKGDRRGLIGTTDAGWPRGGATGQDLINGNRLENYSIQNNISVVGCYTIFDFGTELVISEATWFSTPGDNSGYWNVVGSYDSVTWSQPLCAADVNLLPNAIFDMSSNNTRYRYYKFYGVSGSLGDYYFREIEFKISI